MSKKALNKALHAVCIACEMYRPRNWRIRESITKFMTYCQKPFYNLFIDAIKVSFAFCMFIFLLSVLFKMIARLWK